MVSIMNAVIQKIKTDKLVVLFVLFSIQAISLFLQYEFNLKQSLFSPIVGDVFSDISAHAALGQVGTSVLVGAFIQFNCL